MDTEVTDALSSAEALNDHGGRLNEAGQYEEALQVFEQAAKGYLEALRSERIDEIGYELYDATRLMNQAQTNRYLFRRDTAIKLYREALEKFDRGIQSLQGSENDSKRENVMQLKVRCAIKLSEVLRDEQKREEAIGVLEEIICELSVGTGAPSQISLGIEARLALVTVLLAATSAGGDSSEASLNSVETALTQVKKLLEAGSPERDDSILKRYQLSMHASRGQLAKAKDKPDDAAHHFNRASVLAGELNNRKEQAINDWRRADMLSDPKEAVELALPAALYLDAARFGFSTRALRQNWMEQVALPTLNFVLGLTEEIEGEDQLRAEIIFDNKTIGSYRIATSVTARELGNQSLQFQARAASPSESAPTEQQQTPSLLSSGTEGFQLAPSPRVMLPNGKIALARYIALAEEKYGAVGQIRSNTVIPLRS